MSRTLLQIVTAITQQLSLSTPSSVVGSTSNQALQFLTLLNQEGQELQQDHDWTALQTEFIITVAAPLVTTGTVTLSSGVITSIPDTSTLTAGIYTVSGSGIPVAARVQSVDSGTQVTMNMAATGSATATALTFSRDTYSLPSDFDRYINQTEWDRTNRWRLLGPDTPQLDQWHRSGVVTVGPRRHFRQIGHASSVYRLWPPPNASDSPFQIVFEYVSTDWVNHVGGTYTNSFSADTDTTVFDDNIFILGGKWRFLQAKGLEYAPQQQEYLDYVGRRKAQDGGAQKLSLSPRGYHTLVSPANIRDGFFPGPTGPNTG